MSRIARFESRIARFYSLADQIVRFETYPKVHWETKGCLVDVSDIFIFFCLGEGKGESEAPGGWGGGFFNVKSQEGGGSPEWVGAGPGGCLRAIWGGGLNIFFFGAEIPQRVVS